MREPHFDAVGATSLLTTVEAFALWDAEFDSPRVTAAIRSRMLEPGILNSGEKLRYASGLQHGTYRGLATVGHGGSDAGYRADYLRFPKQRLGIACLCNLGTINPGLLARQVAEVFLGGAMGPASAPAPANAPPGDGFEPAKGIRPDPALLERHAGTYRSEEIELEYRFYVENGRLWLKRLRWRPVEVVPAVPGGFLFPLGSGRAHLQFSTDGDGAVTSFILDAGRVRNVKFSRVR